MATYEKPDACGVVFRVHVGRPGIHTPGPDSQPQSARRPLHPGESDECSYPLAPQTPRLPQAARLVRLSVLAVDTRNQPVAGQGPAAVTAPASRPLRAVNRICIVFQSADRSPAGLPAPRIRGPN